MHIYIHIYIARQSFAIYELPKPLDASVLN